MSAKFLYLIGADDGGEDDDRGITSLLEQSG